MSVHGDIQVAIATRLQSLTAANGYGTDVRSVYHDEIPMGLELNDYQLPAIFLVDNITPIAMKFPIAEQNWQFTLQLWHNRVSDQVMWDFIKDVMKCIYANSPTAQRHDAWRSIHDKIIQIKPLSVAADLNMIEANRVYVLSFELMYRTELFSF